MRPTTDSYHHRNIKEKNSSTALPVYFHFPDFFSVCLLIGNGMFSCHARNPSRFNNVYIFTYFSIYLFKLRCSNKIYSYLSSPLTVLQMPETTEIQQLHLITSAILSLLKIYSLCSLCAIKLHLFFHRS